MKKLLVLVLAVFGFATATFAGSPSSFIYKLNNEKTFNRVASYLSVNSEQKDGLQFVFNEAEKRMERATSKRCYIGRSNRKGALF